MLLYVRNLETTYAWVVEQNLEATCSVHGYEAYGELSHDVVINFVSVVGDPSACRGVGDVTSKITTRFDDMVLTDLERNPASVSLSLERGGLRQCVSTRHGLHTGRDCRQQNFATGLLCDSQVAR